MSQLNLKPTRLKQLLIWMSHIDLNCFKTIPKAIRRRFDRKSVTKAIKFWATGGELSSSGPNPDMYRVVKYRKSIHDWAEKSKSNLEQVEAQEALLELSLEELVGLEGCGAFGKDANFLKVIKLKRSFKSWMKRTKSIDLNRPRFGKPIDIIKLIKMKNSIRGWLKNKKDNLTRPRAPGEQPVGLLKLIQIKKNVKAWLKKKITSLFPKSLLKLAGIKRASVQWQNKAKNSMKSLTNSMASLGRDAQALQDAKGGNGKTLGSGLLRDGVEIRNLTGIDQETQTDVTLGNSRPGSRSGSVSRQSRQEKIDAMTKLKDISNEAKSEAEKIARDLEAEGVSHLSHEDRLRLTELKGEFEEAGKLVAEAKIIMQVAHAEFKEIEAMYKSALESAIVPSKAANSMKSLRGNPPKAVKIVMEAICVLKGIEPHVTFDRVAQQVLKVDYWPTSKKILAGNFVGVLEGMRVPGALEPDNTREFVDTVLNSKGFNRNEIAKAFPPSAVLYDWLIKIYDLGYLYVVFEKREKKFDKSLELYEKGKMAYEFLKKQIAKLEGEKSSRSFISKSKVPIRKFKRND